MTSVTPGICAIAWPLSSGPPVRKAWTPGHPSLPTVAVSMDLPSASGTIKEITPESGKYTFWMACPG